MSYSANNNQNYFIKNGKSTSRVLAPPGGKSSICIGMDDEPEPPKKKKTVVPPVQEEKRHVEEQEQRNDDVHVKNEGKESQKENELVPEADGEKAKEKVEEKPKKKVEEKPISNNAFSRNGYGGNRITGRSSSRILAPPGGHTSIQLW